MNKTELFSVSLGGNICGLEALGAVFYGIRDRLAFYQGFETGALDRAEMDEYVRTAIVLSNKAKTFGFVKPLYSAVSHELLPEIN